MLLNYKFYAVSLSLSLLITGCGGNIPTTNQSKNKNIKQIETKYTPKQIENLKEIEGTISCVDKGIDFKIKINPNNKKTWEIYQEGIELYSSLKDSKEISIKNRIIAKEEKGYSLNTTFYSNSQKKSITSKTFMFKKMSDNNYIVKGYNGRTGAIVISLKKCTFQRNNIEDIEKINGVLYCKDKNNKETEIVTNTKNINNNWSVFIDNAEIFDKMKIQQTEVDISNRFILKENKDFVMYTVFKNKNNLKRIIPVLKININTNSNITADFIVNNDRNNLINIGSCQLFKKTTIDKFNGTLRCKNTKNNNRYFRLKNNNWSYINGLENYYKTVLRGSDANNMIIQWNKILPLNGVLTLSQSFYNNGKKEIKNDRIIYMISENNNKYLLTDYTTNSILKCDYIKDTNNNNIDIYNNFSCNDDSSSLNFNLIQKKRIDISDNNILPNNLFLQKVSNSYIDIYTDEENRKLLGSFKYINNKYLLNVNNKTLECNIRKYTPEEIFEKYSKKANDYDILGLKRYLTSDKFKELKDFKIANCYTRGSSIINGSMVIPNKYQVEQCFKNYYYNFNYKRDIIKKHIKDDIAIFDIYVTTPNKGSAYKKKIYFTKINGYWKIDVSPDQKAELRYDKNHANSKL